MLYLSRCAPALSNLLYFLLAGPSQKASTQTASNEKYYQRNARSDLQSCSEADWEEDSWCSAVARRCLRLRLGGFPPPRAATCISRADWVSLMWYGCGSSGLNAQLALKFSQTQVCPCWQPDHGMSALYLVRASLLPQLVIVHPIPPWPLCPGAGAGGCCLVSPYLFGFIVPCVCVSNPFSCCCHSSFLRWRHFCPSHLIGCCSNR